MPIRPRHLLPFLLILPLCGVTALAQKPSTGLQQRMSGDEFKAAGLDKLSPQELQNLDNWLRTHTKVTTKVIDSSGKPVFYPGDQKRTTIFTHINGHVDGWNKGMIFIMANGQQWKSIDPEAKSCRPSENPEVQVKPSLLGTWLMYVPSCYANVHVKRVR